MPPRRKKAKVVEKKEESESSSATTDAPLEKVVEPPKRSYACDECQRILDEQGKGAFVATKCRECGMAVWFNSTKEAGQYIKTLPDYCEGCRTAPCKGDCETY